MWRSDWTFHAIIHDVEGCLTSHLCTHEILHGSFSTARQREPRCLLPRVVFACFFRGIEDRCVQYEQLIKCKRWLLFLLPRGCFFKCRNPGFFFQQSVPYLWKDFAYFSSYRPPARTQCDSQTWKHRGNFGCPMNLTDLI